MPYCPNCLMEYTEGTDICSVCRIRLLSGLPAEMINNQDDEVDSVLLLKADSVLQAKFLAAALEDAGIPYMARGLGIVDSLGGSSGGSAVFGICSSPRGAEIFINPSDLAAAQQVLDSISGSELSEGQDTDNDSGGSSSGSAKA